MSRSSRPSTTSSATITQPVHPPFDRDIVMGPPPLPAQIAPASSVGARSKDGENQDVGEKYRRLKRKYFELEEKHKDTVIELRSSGERAVRWRSERDALLDRIVELEALTLPGQHPPPHPLLPHPASTAYPRSLNNPLAQKRFHMNLERALAEADVEDPSVDPILTSRHVGPNARKRMEAELKERMEEEAREARRAARRPRGRGKDKEKEKAPEPPARDREFVREPGRPERDRQLTRSERDRERERLERAERDRDGAGPPLTLAPPPGSQFHVPSPPHQQVVVSSSGTRLRIKPPAPPNQHYMDVDSPPRHELLPLPQEEPTPRRDSSRREQLPPSREFMQPSHVMPRQETPLLPRQNPISPQLQEAPRSRQDTAHLLPPVESTLNSQQNPGPSRGHRRGNSRRSVSPPALAPSPPPDAMDEDRIAFAQSQSQVQAQSVPTQNPIQHRPEALVAPQAQAPVSVQSQGQQVQTPPATSGPKSPGQPTRSPTTKYRQVAAAPTPPQSSMPPPLRPVQPAPSSSPAVNSNSTASQMQVYPVTAPNSIMNNLATASRLGNSNVDPMGPNGAAAAMMQTFTPIMHPITSGQASQGAMQIARNKPKRLKAHTVTSKSFSIPVVPRDKKGKPVLPLNVGIMTVVNLGQICMREHFHTERYIFPVGYEVTRRYLSTIDPASDCVYHCTILDGGDGPKFQIIAADQPDKPIIAGTATGAWSVVVRAANHVRNRQHSNSVSGPDFFGLGQNSIKHLIQELPNADRLKDYVWQTFVEGGHLFVHENRQLGGGRHQPALPGPDDQEDADAGDSAAGATQSYYNEEPRELQIIQVPPPDAANPPMALKPLQFHQEFPDREPTREPGRGRRTSVHDAYEFAQDDRVRQQHPPPHSHSQSHSHSHSHSPALSPRASHSPVMQRDREPPYSPQAHRSPYQSPPAAQQVPAVPATFANIMNAYPAPPMASLNSSEPASPYESTPVNGTGRRRSTANGLDR